MNNQSKKPEDRTPQNSDQKHIHHPGDDEKSVVKPEDKEYRKEEAEFDNPALQRERSEQPVNPIKKEPKE
ncbi:MAG: hypothetical protein H7096_11335 [Flavobacterium sp.]|nr:hypothetical protein [Pedobacter sp.]